MRDDFFRFVDLSVVLCGFDKAELLGTGMAQQYFEIVLLENDADDVRRFFDVVAEVLKHPTDAEVTAKLMFVDAYRGLARKIILLWYTGNWGNVPVSAEAYKQGLMWSAAETHPSGAKQPGYGSWASAPISITKGAGAKDDK